MSSLRKVRRAHYAAYIYTLSFWFKTGPDLPWKQRRIKHRSFDKKNGLFIPLPKPSAPVIDFRDVALTFNSN